MLSLSQESPALRPTERPPSGPRPGFSDIPQSARVTTLRFFSGNTHRIAALALAEAVVLFCAPFLAAMLRYPEGIAAVETNSGPLWSRALLVTAIVLGALSSLGLYQLRHRARFTGVLARVIVAVGAGMAALGSVFFLLPGLQLGTSVTALTAALSIAGLAATRLAFAGLVDQEVFKRRVLVWGSGERAATIGQRLRRSTDQRGFRVVGYVNAPGDELKVGAENIYSCNQDLLDIVTRERVHEVVVAMDDRRRGFPEAFLRECRLRGVNVVDIVQFLERETGRVSVELAAPSWLIYSRGFRADMVRVAAKRAFDIAASSVLVVLTLPVMLLATLAIWLEDRGPIFYRQVRTGQGGKPFKIIKFRSMSVNAESGGKAVWAVKNDPRVTRVGAFIRKVRIDELPQAFNVLVGDMSFVGPRPERPEFVQNLQRSIPFYAERHFAKPGITGWAQVRYPYGASENDAREKLGYDLYYVSNHSLVFDFMILLQTVEIVLFRIGSR
ncbi:MAG: TIGR03013 family PEP-CTERM/XrtA system glycosyltransferase [Betaproteobacteria bacterium]|nr:TIGR03013 family PEP-CTERM/XrtA system glycosyltransferase [Betaproteobacteria bacterium]